MELKYNNTAIFLHWFIALAIILQLCGGIWMVGAINIEATKQTAYNFYQYHKSLGFVILVASLFRLFWRVAHKVPPLPEHMKLWEKVAAHLSHLALYVLLIGIPLLGWAMVSTSPYGIPTRIFNLFEWPHIPFLANSDNKLELHQFFKDSHKYTAYLMILLLFIHLSAALKHQFIDKDNLIKRMSPWK
jgi:cytochrome b561